MHNVCQGIAQQLCAPLQPHQGRRASLQRGGDTPHRAQRLCPVAVRKAAQQPDREQRQHLFPHLDEDAIEGGERHKQYQGQVFEPIGRQRLARPGGALREHFDNLLHGSRFGTELFADRMGAQDAQ